MSNTKPGILQFINRFGVFLILIALLLFGTFAVNGFATWGNIMNIFRQNSFVMIIACGITLIAICGKTDLSAGAVCCLSGVIGIDCYMKTDNILVGFLVAIAIGVLCGFVNGAMVSYFNLPAFIATLSMQIFARGAVLLYTDGWPIYNIGRINYLGTNYYPIVFMLLFYLVTWFLLRYTKFARHLFAVGGNEEVALASGIRTKRVIVSTFVFCSAVSAFSGMLLMCRLNSAAPTAAEGYEFEALIGVVLGGTSSSGGIGTITGTFVGCLIVGVINNILNLMGVQSYIHQIIKGLLIAICVIYDINARNKKTK